MRGTAGIALECRRPQSAAHETSRPLLARNTRHRLAAGESITDIHDVRNTAVMRKTALIGWSGVDSTRLDKPGRIEPIMNPYGEDLPCSEGELPAPDAPQPVTVRAPKPKPWEARPRAE